MGHLRRLQAAAGLTILVAGTAAAHPTLERMRLTGSGPTVGTNAAFAASNITVLSHIPLDQFPSNPFRGNDCWGYVSPSGREYALMGLFNATAIVEVTDPAQPQIIASFESTGSVWRDIKVLGEYAYVVTEESDLGIQVLDLSRVDEGIATEAARVFPDSTRSTHNIVINEDTGCIYRAGAGFGNGLRMYTTGAPDALGNSTPGTPTNPVLVGIAGNTYVHDAQVVTWQRPGPLLGRELAFNCVGQGKGLYIYDVTDKSNPVRLSRIPYGAREYTHQGWLSEDQRYFYLNDELDEFVGQVGCNIRIFDVSDPTNPIYLGMDSNGGTAVDHNLYVHDNLLYASSYTEGLRVFDLSDPEDPTEVASIDTFPANNGITFDGVWSNYPFLPSGNVLISDINAGLLVVRIDVPSLRILPGEAPRAIDPDGGSTIDITIEPLFDKQLDPSSVVMRVRDESGMIQSISPDTPTPGTFRFHFGPGDCGSTAEYWFEAITTDDLTTRFPTVDNLSVPFAQGFTQVFNNTGLNDPNFESWPAGDEGAWTAAMPDGLTEAEPTTDFDGNNAAWLTGANGEDVGSQPVILSLPPIDTTGGGILSWAYWFNDRTFDDADQGDMLTVEVTDLESPSPTPVEVARYTIASDQWRTDSLAIGPGLLIGETSQLRVEFIATDGTNPSIVEAGVDAIRFEAFSCTDNCTNSADINNDGQLTGADFNAWLTAFTQDQPQADQNDDGVLNGSDFNAWLTNFARGCR